jgi:hypothetical protein
LRTIWEVGLVIGILLKSAHAEVLLSNLAEADFDLKDVSVIMRDIKARNAIAKDAGPFKGIAPSDLSAKLAHFGLSEQDVKVCTDAVSQGKVLVGITCAQASESAAVEMFKDHSAEFIKAVKA